MLDQPLSECIDRAIARLSHTCRDSPAAGAALLSWATRLSPTGRARDYFDGGRAVLFVLPWWLEKRIRTVPDLSFQQRLVESSVNAYYFVRLIDNVMDEREEDARSLLPLLGVLHTRFIRAYAELFPPDALFWEYFDRYWSATTEAALREKTLRELSADDFVNVAARKTSGIKIPLAAVCCRYGRLDLLEPWCAFYDTLAGWQQMADDTLDWAQDLRHGNGTLFLSEGRRQACEGESISGWFVRRGFAWGMQWLDDTMRDLRRQAEQLACPELVRFLDYRDAEMREHRLELTPKLKEVELVVDAFEPLGAESR